MARGDRLGRQWKVIQTLISSRIGKSAINRKSIEIVYYTMSRKKESRPYGRTQDHPWQRG